MCGIFGCVGHRPAVPLVLEGLKRLEYRGYDSSGIAWMSSNKIGIIKAKGKLETMDEKLQSANTSTSTCAIGHTRWATHGEPSERNAHPHLSNDAKLVIVHNGIIENYQDLKERLKKLGFVFYSDTDTEVLVNLIELHQREKGNILDALKEALKEAHGAYAIALLSVADPQTIYAARMSAPLIIGKGTGENFVASDIPAFLPYTRNVIFLEDGDIARISVDEILLFNLNSSSKVIRESQRVLWDMQAAQKGGYRHFMLKEIFEQPRVIEDGLSGRTTPAHDHVCIQELEKIPVPERIVIVACGTSYHSGLWAKHLFENWSSIPVEVEIASEYRYAEKLLFSSGSLGIFISQSGETADSLAALKRVKEKGMLTLGLCNVVGSSIAREADISVFTQAGPEISVASTKAMCSQMLALSLMALYWGKKRNIIDEEKERKFLDILFRLPAILDDHLPGIRKKAKELAPLYSFYGNFFFLGREIYYPLALEGSLKLKELSYIHSEGYAAGEMKHGPIALIDPNFPSFVLAMPNNLFPKIKSNIQEIKARRGKVIALTTDNADLEVDEKWILPEIEEPFSSFLMLPALQLFSYEIADFLGKDVDQPRNLAKSVTVE